MNSSKTNSDVEAWENPPVAHDSIFNSLDTVVQIGFNPRGVVPSHLPTCSANRWGKCGRGNLSIPSKRGLMEGPIFITESSPI